MSDTITRTELEALRVSHAQLKDQCDGLKVELFQSQSNEKLMESGVTALKHLLESRTETISTIHKILTGRQVSQDQNDKLGEIYKTVVDAGFGI